MVRSSLKAPHLTICLAINIVSVKINCNMYIVDVMGASILLKIQILISFIVLVPTSAGNSDQENIDLDAASDHVYAYIPTLGMILHLEPLSRVADDELLEEEQQVLASDDILQEQYMFENISSELINKTELRLNKTINKVETLIKNIDTLFSEADLKINATVANLNNTLGKQSGNDIKRYVDWVKDVRLDMIDPIDDPPYVPNSFSFDPVLDKMFFKNPKPVDEEVDVEDYLRMGRNENIKRSDMRPPNENKKEFNKTQSSNH